MPSKMKIVMPVIKKAGSEWPAIMDGMVVALRGGTDLLIVR